eukprot:TRINITY_DN5308_c0_g1_i1.p1 TRINITY_DN5308_c0_g1~~TRINITY_DN5308_c0_g1_i1.p1  ORF type:complete len:389 (+),score=77.05 TRINITY_DN5308_c0_g1_i1:31-1167(+)
MDVRSSSLLTVATSDEDYVAGVCGASEVTTAAALVAATTALVRSRGAVYDAYEAAEDIADAPVLEGRHSFYRYHFSRPTYCNQCREFIYGIGKQAYLCNGCNYVCHEKCLQTVIKRCRPSYGAATTPHFWVEGNLSVCGESGSCCAACHKDCGSYSALTDYRCSWCLKTAHSTNCKNAINQNCDFGVRKQYILPPSVLCVKGEGDVVVKANPVLPAGNIPLAVFINKRSGGQQGKAVIATLRNLLNPRQVFDLSKGGPEPGLRFMQALPAFQVLACGGDGTVGWVLETIRKTGLRPHAVSVIPLGTGNDLARALGWGGGYSGEDLAGILAQVASGRVSLLDRWYLNVAPLDLVTRTLAPYKQVNVINNYFSIGGHSAP